MTDATDTRRAFAFNCSLFPVLRLYYVSRS